MRKMTKKCICLLMIVTLMLSTVAFAFAVDGVACPLKVEITTNRDSYSTLAVAKFTVKVINVSETAVDNISVENLGEQLAPLGSRSVIKTETESLAPGVSIEFSFKVTLNKNTVDLSGIQRSTLAFVRMWYKNINVVDNGFDNQRYFFDTTKTLSFGKFCVTDIVRVWYGQEMLSRDRLIEFNDGVKPEVTMDEEDGIPSFILGSYTNRTILNAKDAIDSLKDVQGFMYVANPAEEFEVIGVSSNDGITQYNLQQVHKGIKIYAKNIIITIDDYGKVISLSGDYEPGINVNTTPTISDIDANNVVVGLLGSEIDVKNIGLTIYTMYNNEDSLVWQVEVTGFVVNEEIHRYYFISAVDGNIICKIDLIQTETVTGSGVDVNGTTQTFNAWKNSPTSYEMYDKVRMISVYNANKVKVQKEWPDVNSFKMWDNNLLNDIEPVESNNNTWPDKNSVTLIKNVAACYDYYYNSFRRVGFDGNGGEVVAVYNDAFQSGNNAYSSGYKGYYFTLLCFGYNLGVNKLDVVAHEYTHSVERSISNMTYQSESGALMEAYSDIMGEIIQNDNSWVHSNQRNLIQPGLSGQCASPDRVNGSNYWSPNDLSWDAGGVHVNATIIGHAAYLMWLNGISDKQELATVFYRSLRYLSATSGFDECRAAVLAAGRDMNIGATKINIIKKAFDDVNIKNNGEVFFASGKLSGKVASTASGNPAIPGATIVAKTCFGISLGRTESGADGKFELKLPPNYIPIYENIGLPIEYYSIEVSAPGYLTLPKSDIIIKADETTYIQNPILLKVNTDPSTTEFKTGGKVIDSLNGQGVSGVTVKFRQGHGKTSGEYAKSSAGTVVSLTTDASGTYITKALPYGYFTAEVSKDGYVTGYTDVFSSDEDSVGLNQNISITRVMPEGQYRIVLRWGLNPSDLDSHLTGPLAGGGSFHIYFSNKNAYNNGVLVANLDLDDVTSYGPETVTLNPDISGTFKYFVHHYAGSGSISTSSAQVQLFKGNTLLSTYNAPTDQGAGIIWNVFNIENGVIKNINTITNSVSQAQIVEESKS